MSEILNNNDIVKLIMANIKLFDEFDKVYIFGSVLEFDKHSNDIDVLLLYSVFSAKIEESIIQINKCLEEISVYPLDVTVLSFEEEKDTNFINRLNNRYLCVK